MKIILIPAMALLFTGCGTLNNALAQKTKNVEYYRIFDIKTNADRYVIGDSASNGLGRNVNNATEARPIPSTTEIPQKAGRFTLNDPFEGTKFGALMGGGGSLGFKIATCKDAVWTANATREIGGDSNLRLTACLFPYKDGYHLDLYATFSKQEGGLMQISRSMAHAMVGTPEEWTEKTFLDIVRQIRKDTGAEVALVEGYPKIQGTPWLDDGEAISAKN